jgi:hypothetical protein
MTHDSGHGWSLLKIYGLGNDRRYILIGPGGGYTLFKKEMVPRYEPTDKKFISKGHIP